MDWNSLNQSMTSTLMKIMNCANKSWGRWRWGFLCSNTSCWFYKRELLKGKIHCCSHRAIGVNTLSFEEQNPQVDFLGVGKYIFLDDKFDRNFGPSVEIKEPCSKKISEAFMLCELKGKQNLGSMDEYADLFLAMVMLHFGKKKLQIRIHLTRFIMSKKRLTNSMLIPLLSLEKKGWKWMIGHLIDRGKDLII